LNLLARFVKGPDRANAALSGSPSVRQTDTHVPIFAKAGCSHDDGRAAPEQKSRIYVGQCAEAQLPELQLTVSVSPNVYCYSMMLTFHCERNGWRQLAKLDRGPGLRGRRSEQFDFIRDHHGEKTQCVIR